LSTGPTTWYPGVGADEEIAKLERLVGKITAFWAEVEDELFAIFMFAVSGKWWMDAMAEVEPYRAVFFTFSSYESKMRMLHNAMRVRFESNEKIWTEWKELRKACNDLVDQI
jgi:hypothetical protein